MRTLEFKVQPTNAFFATVNIAINDFSKLVVFAYCYGLKFSETMALLLSVLWDFSVRCREITLVINRIQSANS